MSGLVIFWMLVGIIALEVLIIVGIVLAVGYVSERFSEMPRIVKGE